MYGKINAPNGEKNLIEHVSVNGTEIKPVNRAVNIPIPESTENTTYTLTKSGDMLTLNGSDGSKSSVNDSDTTYSEMKGASASAAGMTGLVPAPEKGAATRFLRSDGTWQTPPDTTYSKATQSEDGLMSAADKAKLDGIPSGGLKAYTGTFRIDNGGSYKIATAARPKLMMIWITWSGSNFNGDSICCFTESGNYISGDVNAGVVFADDGITITWPSGYSDPVGTSGHRYVVLC